MLWRVTPEGAVHFTKRSMYLAFCWPPPRNSTKNHMQTLNILWWMSFLSSITLLGPLLMSIYQFRGNALIVTKSTLFSLAIANFAIKMIVCRLNRKRMQKLIYEMDDYLKAAEPHGRIILQNYVDRCATLYSTLTIIYYFTTAAVVCGPFILPQTFPTTAVYPFPADSIPVFIVIYIHQAFVGFQCSTGLTIDCQSALLLWFTGARFQILADNATRVNKLTFHDFVKEHQHLLNYADDVKYVTRYVVLTTAMMTGLGTAFSGLQLISVAITVVYSVADQTNDFIAETRQQNCVVRAVASAVISVVNFWNITTVAFRVASSVVQYARAVKRASRYIGTNMHIYMTFNCCWIERVIIQPQPMLVKIQFLTVALSAVMNLYTCAWPADNLAAVSNSIGNSLYNSPWLDSPTKMIKNYLFVIRRSQKSTVVTVGGFIPVLSLQFYGSFLSTAFSYFTTLRMTMDVESSEI